MYHEGQPLSAIMPEMMRRLEACRDRFDEIAADVEKAWERESAELRRDLHKYIDGLRTIATGTIEFWWVLVSPGLDFR